MTTTTSVAQAAAEQLAAHMPTAVPLTVAPFDGTALPPADAEAVRAHFVGGTSADLVLVADAATAAVVADAGDDVTVADALRPALEAASQTLGAGVLDHAQVAPLGNAFDDPAMEAFALVDPTGVPQAWFGIRVRAAVTAVKPIDLSVDVAAERNRMRILHDVELVLTAEIGHTRLPMRQVLELVPGTVLELDRAAGSPADVMVNGRIVARGEVVVIDEDYGIRITEIISAEGGQ